LIALTKKNANRLINEKSPYLLMHAHNPVDWYPWGEEAFKRAVDEDRPIFLSIGYSTCHWCHVMEHEAFSDPKIAALMNETFVNIKVDREERPDIDGIYMAVCQMMTGGGGWPLTIIMTPEKKPIFATTYIPPKGAFGRSGMVELVPQIKDLWEKDRARLLGSAEHIFAELLCATGESPGERLDHRVLGAAFKTLWDTFDDIYGGFGAAPKFPTPHRSMFLLRYWARTKDKRALQMVKKTLGAMQEGGIFDQLGGGFHRYSTDGQWLVPHFEKMLYDQAMISMACTEAYLATGDKQFERTARQTLEYVLRDMTAPEGVFYSAEDADSEGVEGKFYLWTKEEVLVALGKKDGEVFCKAFGVLEDGNFKEEATGDTVKTNVLHRAVSLEVLAKDIQMQVADLEALLDSSIKKMLAVRAKRVRPSCDDKVLTDWNGLMVAALSKAARAFDEPKFATAAKNAVDFVLHDMRREDGRLLHRYREGKADILGFVDDHTFMIWGLIELYEATFEIRYLKEALAINKDLLMHFWDEEVGGLYFAPDDAEALLVRQKEVYDGAIPSGNSVSMYNFLRLAKMTSEKNLNVRAAKIGRTFAEAVRRAPASYAMLLSALDLGLGPSFEAILVGDLGSEDLKRMLVALSVNYLPNVVLLHRPVGTDPVEIDTITGFTVAHELKDNKATAYICTDQACKEATTDHEKMLALLREGDDMIQRRKALNK
jgi:uncharacterized protein